MNTEQPNYYAIIPANVRYDKSLAPNAKLLYGEITALCNHEGFCWASDTYFANLYGLSRERINRLIKKLKDQDHIYIVLETENNLTQRKIFLKNPPLESDKNVTGGVTKKSQGVLKKGHTNNTINNTINNNVELDLHNEICSIFNRNPNSYKLSDKRKKILRSRLKDNGAENIIKSCKNLSRSEWHMGKNDRGWVAEPYWVLTSYEKCEEWSNKKSKTTPLSHYKTVKEIFNQEDRRGTVDPNRIKELKQKLYDKIGGRK